VEQAGSPAAWFYGFSRNRKAGVTKLRSSAQDSSPQDGDWMPPRGGIPHLLTKVWASAA